MDGWGWRAPVQSCVSPAHSRAAIPPGEEEEGTGKSSNTGGVRLGQL